MALISWFLGSVALIAEVTTAARLVWLKAGRGGSVIILASATVAANSDGVVRNS